MVVLYMYVVKINAQLVCAFVYAYAKPGFLMVWIISGLMVINVIRLSNVFICVFNFVLR